MQQVSAEIGVAADWLSIGIRFSEQLSAFNEGVERAFRFAQGQPVDRRQHFRDPVPASLVCGIAHFNEPRRFFFLCERGQGGGLADR